VLGARSPPNKRQRDTTPLSSSPQPRERIGPVDFSTRIPAPARPSRALLGCSGSIIRSLPMRVPKAAKDQGDEEAIELFLLSLFKTPPQILRGAAADRQLAWFSGVPKVLTGQDRRSP
jgi:hypothetical protein